MSIELNSRNTFCSNSIEQFNVEDGADTKMEVMKTKASNIWNRFINTLKGITQKIKALPGRVSKFLKAHKREALIVAGVALVVLGAVTPLGFIPAAIGGGMIVYNGVKLHQERNESSYHEI